MTTKPSKEKLVKAQVKRLLDKHGWFWWMPPANGFGMTGISDFNALRHGVFLAIETKFGKNVPTAQQKAYLNSARAMDGFAFVVNDSNIDNLEIWMSAFDRSIGAAAQQQPPTPEDGAAMLNAISVMTELL